MRIANMARKGAHDAVRPEWRRVETMTPSENGSPVPPWRSATDLFEVRLVMFDVESDAAEDVEAAAREVAAHSRANEPGTRFFAVMRDDGSPGRFVCAAVFDDDAAERVHRSSGPARRFAKLLLAAGVRLNFAHWTGVAGI